jgi:beta-glucosidase
LRFPNGFEWGVSTCAYQIEGALDLDGRGASVWDDFCRQPGRIEDGSTSDIATDHYHRWPEDLALLSELQATTYRFSVAWPRIQPVGSGPANAQGLDFYERIVDELLRRDIDPILCLHHWDLPQALEERGGWLNRETAYRFADYTRLVADRLADRVRRWATLNEPNVEACAGHVIGWHPPGHRSLFEGLRATHHLLLAHGLGAAALRSRAEVEVGIILALTPVLPAKPTLRDRLAAWLVDLVFQRSVTDPILLGRFPGPLRPLMARWSRPGDLAQISARLEFLGVNHYTPLRVTKGNTAPLGIAQAPAAPGTPTTAKGFEIDPSAFLAVLTKLKSQYGNPPVLVTEIGAAFRENADRSGFVSDTNRLEYLRGYLAALHEAISLGCDVRGCLFWTLVDGFEWVDGFEKRFGLVRLEDETLRRVPKASFRFARQLFGTNILQSEP